jgi:ubiquitin carboxyl-terminal hydrolase 10
MCFANSVLQILVHSPPFWKLFSDLKGQRGEGGPKISGNATSLVDATVRFCEEFMFRGKEPLQQAARRKSREYEEAKKENDAVDSFKPTYMYDAMKEKRQLKNFLVLFPCPVRFAAPDMYSPTCTGWPTSGCGRVFPILPRRA